MNRPDITLVLARAANGVIGAGGKIPWHLPADLKHFKAQTMGKPMIMGRKTFESFPAPLPGRRHIVLTRDRRWSAEGAEGAHDVEGALALAGVMARVCGWRPGEFWAATPAEVAAVLAGWRGDDDGGGGIDGAALAAMMEQYPDG